MAPSAASLFREIAAEALEDLYAIEIVAVLDDILAILDPLSSRMHALKTLSPSELTTISRAVRLVAPPGLGPFRGFYIFVAANFPRNEILFGRRGYRRTLLEAGHVAEAVRRSCLHTNLRSVQVHEFDDRRLDFVLDFDGVEQTTLVAFEVW
jgi:hypothetical protein